jgi:hypothetical protein
MNARSAARERGEADRFPPQIALGLALVAVAWPLAWSGIDPISRYTFFPLWLGYILTVDGTVRWRTGTSLLTRSARRFAALFVGSAPLWWLFEAFNIRVDNWRYVIGYGIGRVEYALLASLAFSTVIPALFETADLVRSWPLFRRPRHWLRIDLGRRGLLAVAGAGLIMVALTLIFPRQAFPLVWLGLFFVLDPIGRLLGANSLSGQVAQGRWDAVWVLFLAGITCGFFWEMWNTNASPKWVYDVPYVGSPKLFEMPLLGYGGYFPFALEVYALYQIGHRLLVGRADGYLTFDRSPPLAGPSHRRDR